MSFVSISRQRSSLVSSRIFLPRSSPVSVAVGKHYWKIFALLVRLLFILGKPLSSSPRSPCCLPNSIRLLTFLVNRASLPHRTKGKARIESLHRITTLEEKRFLFLLFSSEGPNFCKEKLQDSPSFANNSRDVFG